MKKTIFMFLLFISTLSFGQTKSTERRKSTINKDSVSYVKIGKYLRKPKYIIDSSYNAVFRNINAEQANYFINQWNNANYVGAKKVKPKYCIDIYLKNGSIKCIKINNTLCEKNIYQFAIQDNAFLNKLWENATEK